jgi:hypothetical protein
MKRLLVLAVTFLISIGSYAGCIGSESFHTCYDDSGNSYTVNRLGDSTYVKGTNSNGESWSQQSQKYGNMTVTNGHDKDGNSWNSTTTHIGSGSTITTGRDSDGNSFSTYCNKITGCN